MKTRFILNNDSGNCSLYINDTSDFDSVNSLSTLRLDSSITLDVVVKQSNGIGSIYNTKVSENKVQNQLPLKSDGHYFVYHIIVPTEKWLDEIKSKYDISYILEFFGNFFYYYNNTKKQFIKVTKDSEEEISIENFYDINNSSLFKCKSETFSICKLMKCFINYCKLVFEQQTNKCELKNSTLIYARDFVWMAINTIQYYIDLNMLSEAERLLDEIQGCNGFCEDNSFNIIKQDSGCGCSN